MTEKEINKVKSDLETIRNIINSGSMSHSYKLTRIKEIIGSKNVKAFTQKTMNFLQEDD